MRRQSGQSAATDALARHHARRGARVPTVSVLAGRLGLAIGTFRRWARDDGRVLSVSRLSEHDGVPASWRAALRRTPELRTAAAAHLAATARARPDQIEDVLSSPSADRGRLLARLADGTATTACALALVGGDAEAPIEVTRQLEGIAGLCRGRDHLPAWLVVCDDAGDRVPLLATALEAVLDRVPQLPVGLAIEADVLACVLRGGHSRWRALLREGHIPVATPAAAIDDAGPALRRLREDGATDELVAAYRRAEAARDEPPATGTGGPGPRSEAEHFLFERLDSLPATAGLFEMNGRLGFRFGPGRAEVDLLSRSLRLAIEVDGHYHFTGDDAYRRDRRKDLLLQRHGYTVLRVLAGDVVTRLEEILDAVRKTVEWRRTEHDGGDPR